MHWTLSIDDGNPMRHSGKTAAVTGMAPGVHKFKVEGSIQNRAKRTEVAQSVTAGTVATLELVLA